MLFENLGPQSLLDVGGLWSSSVSLVCVTEHQSWPLAVLWFAMAHTGRRFSTQCGRSSISISNPGEPQSLLDFAISFQTAVRLDLENKECSLFGQSITLMKHFKNQQTQQPSKMFNITTYTARPKKSCTLAFCFDYRAHLLCHFFDNLMQCQIIFPSRVALILAEILY